ncbi:MAG: dihydrolipoyllysine-residue succinyltransferase [Chlamydiales bacterium]
MKSEIKVPAMGESITEAHVGAILKPSGAYVQANEEILELETEKVNQSLYAPEAGEVSWQVEEGAVVRIGDVVGFVDSGKKGEYKPQEQVETTPPVKSASVSTSESIRESAPEFIASLEKKAPLLKQERADMPPKPNLEGRENRRKMSRIRQVIGKRLVDALHNAAMLTTFNEVDMSEIMLLRAKYKESFLEKHGVKLGFMSFFVKAVVESLKLFPDFNAYLDGEELVQRNYFDIGIAVGTERGLIVPVLRGCDRLSFAMIEQEIAEYAKRARKSGLKIEDLEGGCFTITNGGVYGSLLSTPILNPPQVGILGMHAIQNRPIAVKDRVEIRPMMYLALSYDHRVVDGKEAVSFLMHVKKVLEDPSQLLFLESS